MLQMHRDLRRLGSYHEDYQRIFDQTALALDGIEVSIQEINVKGAQILNALGSRMDDARELIAEIDALTREAKRQQSVLKAELKELSKALMPFCKRQTALRLFVKISICSMMKLRRSQALYQLWQAPRKMDRLFTVEPAVQRLRPVCTKSITRSEAPSALSL
jgi:hypothetical protein